MKTAEEWRKHFKVWAEEWASDKEVQTIQLDAMREGMRRAAEIANAAQNRYNTVKDAQTSILEASEKLTEKDL